MNPITLHVRGVNSVDDTTIDFTQIGPGLCAVIGGNGAGKTTILECAGVAASWRTMPTRPGKKPGNVIDCATDRDTLIDLTQEHDGHEWRHVIQIDAGLKHPKTEAYLYRDGELLNDGKIGTYDDAIAKHFPPLSLILASSFAAQGGAGSLAQLSVAERRSLFRQMLGLDHLQRLSDRAAKHRKAADSLLTDLQRDEERLRATEIRATEIDDQIGVEVLKTDGLRFASDQADQASTAAQIDLRSAQDALSALAEARTEALRKRGDLERRVSEASGRLEAATGDMAKAKAVTASADQIRADQVAAQGLGLALQEARDAYRSANDAWNRATSDIGSHGDRKAQAMAEAGRTESDAAMAESASLGISELEVKAGALAKAREQRPGLRGQMVACVATLDAAQKARHEASTAAANARRDVRDAEIAASQLDQVPCGGRVLDSIDCGSCSILHSATQSRDALPGLRAASKTSADACAAVADAHSRADHAHAGAVGALDKLDAEIAKLSGADVELASAREKAAALPELRKRAADLKSTIADCDAKIAAATQAQAERGESRAAAQKSGEAARGSLDAIGDHAQRLQSLESAEARIPLLRQAVEDHAATRDAAQAELDAIEIPPEPEERQAAVRQLVAGSEQATVTAATARAALDEHARALARLRGQREGLGDFAGHLSEVTTARAAIGRRRAGFAMIERAMGPTGIQALEIDAAGPGVSDIATDLLRAAGVEYTAQIRTQAGGGRKKIREIFDVMVGLPDGGDRELAAMSFGERTLIEEAIKLAIAPHVSRSAGAPCGTLWRDECDGDLSEENADRYPGMLRAALELGGFDRCFFVTHRPAVAVQADWIILVDDQGRAEVMSSADYAAVQD